MILGYLEEFEGNPPPSLSHLLCQAAAPLAVKQPSSMMLPPAAMDRRHGVLGVKGLTFSPLDTLLDIVAKQLGSCFVWPQNSFSVISSKLWSSLKGATFGARACFIEGSLSVHDHGHWHLCSSSCRFLADLLFGGSRWTFHSPDQFSLSSRCTLDSFLIVAVTTQYHALHTYAVAPGTRNQVAFLTGSSQWLAFSGLCWAPLIFTLQRLWVFVSNEPCLNGLRNHQLQSLIITHRKFKGRTLKLMSLTQLSKSPKLLVHVAVCIFLTKGVMTWCSLCVCVNFWPQLHWVGYMANS